MTPDEAAIRADERERCCRAICPHCRAGVPVVRSLSDGFIHDDVYGSPCLAAPLRSLEAEP